MWKKITTCNHHLLCLKARMTTLVLWMYISTVSMEITRVVLFAWQKTHPRGYSKTVCTKQNGNQKDGEHWSIKLFTVISYLKYNWRLFTLCQDRINVGNKWKKKPIATDMRQNRWLFTSFTKELNLGLPKLLSLTDLYENFVMWPTVQELLLDIVVFVSLVNSN